MGGGVVDPTQLPFFLTSPTQKLHVWTIYLSHEKNPPTFHEILVG